MSFLRKCLYVTMFFSLASSEFKLIDSLERM